jgi:hypothetical protein
VVWTAALPTWGLSVILAPLTLVLSIVAWRRAPHDAVFWIGASLNGLLIAAFFGEIVSVLTGEASIEWE